MANEDIRGKRVFSRSGPTRPFSVGTAPPLTASKAAWHAVITVDQTLREDPTLSPWHSIPASVTMTFVSAAATSLPCWTPC
ncbi:MAG: hypothetical protein ACM3ZO_02195 [Clostridia bacterium]